MMHHVYIYTRIPITPLNSNLLSSATSLSYYCQFFSASLQHYNSSNTGTLAGLFVALAVWTLKIVFYLAFIKPFFLCGSGFPGQRGLLLSQQHEV